MAKRVIFKHGKETHQLFIGRLPGKPFFVADERTLQDQFRLSFIRKNNVTCLYVLYDSPAQQNILERVQGLYTDEGIRVRGIDLYPLKIERFRDIDAVFHDLKHDIDQENIMLFSFDSTANTRLFLHLFLIFLGKEVETSSSLISTLFNKLPDEGDRLLISRYALERKNRLVMDLAERKAVAKISHPKEPVGRKILKWYMSRTVAKKEREKGEDKGGYRITFSLRTRLIGSVSAIIIVSMLGMIFLATWFFKDDNVNRVLENNLNLASLVSEKVRSDIENLARNGSAILMGSLGGGIKEEQLFAKKSSIIMTGVIKKRGRDLTVEKCIMNPFYRKGFKNGTACGKTISARAKSLSRCFSGDTVIINISPQLKRPAAAMALPMGKGRAMLLFVAMENFYRNLKTQGIVESLLVNGEGETLVHPESSRVLTGMVMLNDPVVRNMLTSTVPNRQIHYRDNEGKKYLASFSRVGVGGLGVIMRVQEDKALAAVYNIQERNIYILIIVLTLAILFLYFFARSLTRPIIDLAHATEQIKRGDYHIDLKPSSGDEIGLLTESFVAMGQGLEERERIKDAFGKFVNREIAEEVLRGELSLGGQRVQAVIMFTDIRSFTEMSEQLEPEKVVEILNDYFSRMVACINRGEGIVDKFIGDAIMALWGVPSSHSDDVIRAVDTALMMREALYEYNQGAEEAGFPRLQIGCGISIGDVVAGKIGSSDRMEYTVIGRSVNIASRIEALNKPFGTDILVTRDVYEKVKDIYKTEKMQDVTVKGKKDVLAIYAVLGRRNDAATPGSLGELQRRYVLKAGERSEGNEEVKSRIIP